MQHELIPLRRIACDENTPSGGTGDLQQKVVGSIRGQAQSIRVVSSCVEEEVPFGKHLAERAEAQQQRQAEQERECLRTQQMKSTLEEVVNASRERFIATHGAKRSNSEQLRAVDLQPAFDKSRRRAVELLAVSEPPQSCRLESLPSSCLKACNKEVEREDVRGSSPSEIVEDSALSSRGLAGQHPGLSCTSSGDNKAPVVDAMENTRTRSASSSANNPLLPASWLASSAAGNPNPAPRTRPGLQRDRGGIGRLGVGGQSTGRLEANKTADRSSSPSRRAAPAELRARTSERRSDSLERRSGRSVSPSNARHGSRPSYLADTTTSSQKRAGSQGRSRPHSAGPRLSDRRCREVTGPTPTSSALKSRPLPSNTPRGLKGGGARGGSTGTLHTVTTSSSGSLQAPAVARQRSGGGSSSSTGVKTPRGAFAGTSPGTRTLGARDSGMSSSGPLQRKRQSYSSLEAPTMNGTSSPPRSTQSWSAASNNHGCRSGETPRGIASNSSLPSSRRGSQTAGPTVRPPAPPSNNDNNGRRGGAVLAELNCLERLRQAGESTEPLTVVCPQKAGSELLLRHDEVRTVRPGVRDRGLSELGAAVVASVRLPAEKERERLREVGSRCVANPNESTSIESCDAPLEEDNNLQAEKPQMEMQMPDVPNEAQEAPLCCDNIIMQEAPASLLTSLSPLSPIREVAEGGATPKALDSREVLEVQAQESRELHGRSSAQPKRQLDLEEPAIEPQEDLSLQDSLAQLPSSKERYLQIRDRFLSK